MRYYLTEFSCMGFINGKYQLFATADEYAEILREVAS